MNECSGTLPDRNEAIIVLQHSRIHRLVKNGAEVALVTIPLQEHTHCSQRRPQCHQNQEPKARVDTAQIAWDFISKHSK